MTERVDNIKYVVPSSSSTVEGLETTLLLTGPAEFLCARIAAALKEQTPWREIFGESIDGYKRMDYSVRSLPALRIYCNGYTKEFESWYINGQITLDMIFPASLRRTELQQLPSTLAAGMLQQFRRPSWFEALCAVVPGLNELGKRFGVDTSLGFEWGDGDEVVPLTQLQANFRMDLAAWDKYLESDNRTKDEPFARPLGDLRRIVTLIEALKDDGETDVTLGIDQTIE